MKKKYPKLRAWAKPKRKIMTMVIPSEKDKQRKRSVQKRKLKKELKRNYGL